MLPEKSTTQEPLPLWHPRVIQWRNLFVFVDDGTIGPAEYIVPARMVHAQAKHYGETGLGCIVIIPENAKPPPDETRKAIDKVLADLGTDLKCLVWVVEGKGFASAAVRGALTGLSMIRRRPYATSVESRIDGALSWTLSRVGQPSTDIQAGVAAIMHERAKRKQIAA
jgi:hypothetical protein